MKKKKEGREGQRQEGIRGFYFLLTSVICVVTKVPEKYFVFKLPW